MPIKIKNQNVIPSTLNVETVHALNLDIPLEGDLPLGAQAELADITQAFEDKQIGGLQYTLRLFCLFTRRLPSKRDHVQYDWLALQRLEDDEVREVTNAVSAILGALNTKRADGGAGNASKPKRATKS